jgi:hypothetical protein
MVSSVGCLKRAQQCVEFSNAPDCTMQTRTTLMAMARSWTLLAGEMDTLAALVRSEKGPVSAMQEERLRRS